MNLWRAVLCFLVSPCGLRSLLVMLMLGVSQVFSAPLFAQQKGPFYNLGVSAAVAEYCGHNDIVSELTKRYERLKDFEAGFELRENSYFKRGARDVDCGELALSLNAFLDGVREGEAWAAEQGIDLYVELSEEDRRLALNRVYDDIMANILAKDESWVVERYSDRSMPISAYRGVEVHGRKHKSLAACLSWDDEEKALSYHGWWANGGHDWALTKYVSERACRNERYRTNLFCECQLVDFDGENMLELPDYILSRYQGLIEVDEDDDTTIPYTSSWTRPED